jgi:hypothetical protein
MVAHMSGVSLENVVCLAILEHMFEAPLTCDGPEVAASAEWAEWADDDWSEDEWAAWSAALIAGDPGDPADWSPPSTSTVLASATHAPVTPALVAQLSALEPATLSDHDRVAAAAGWARVRDWAAARLGQTVAAHVAATKPATAVNGRIVISARRQAAAEIGAALRLGGPATDSLINTATEIATRLPGTAEMLARGDLSWDKATALASRTVDLTPEQVAAVEERVLPAATRRIPSRHADAVRRAVDRVDPEGAAERARQARKDVALIRTHHGNGVGELLARMPAEDLDTVWTAADVWARGRKAAGDERTLDQLRVAALVHWARSFMRHGNASHCDVYCDPFMPDGCSCQQGSPTEPVAHEPAADEPPAPSPADSPPTRHGRAVAVRMLWDLPGLLGLSQLPGELADSGATLSAETMREVLARGVQLRRLLVDPTTGELADLTPRTWEVKPADGSGAHTDPVLIDLILDTDVHRVLTTGDVADVGAAAVETAQAIADALASADPELAATVNALIDHRLTADELDSTPGAYPASARLSEFIAARDRHPVNPTAGLSPAAAADNDHTLSVRNGGTTTRDNLASSTRRWHLLTTHGGWTVERVGRQWRWTSPSGHSFTTEPHDYRRGP